MAVKQVKCFPYHDPLYDPVSLALTLACASTYPKEDISLMTLFQKKSLTPSSNSYPLITCPFIS